MPTSVVELVLYPPAQLMLEHDLPPLLEEEDEDEFYSALFFTMEATMGGPQTEDDLVENFIENPPPNVLPLEELVKETQANALGYLCVAVPTPLQVKNVEFSVERTLKINSSLSIS